MSEMEGNLSPRQRRQQRELKYVEALTKVKDLQSLLVSVDAGAFTELASTIGSCATTDFKTEHDEKNRRRKTHGE